MAKVATVLVELMEPDSAKSNKRWVAQQSKPKPKNCAQLPFYCKQHSTNLVAAAVAFANGAALVNALYCSALIMRTSGSPMQLCRQAGMLAGEKFHKTITLLSINPNDIIVNPTSC